MVSCGYLEKKCDKRARKKLAAEEAVDLVAAEVDDKGALKNINISTLKPK